MCQPFGRSRGSVQRSQTGPVIKRSGWGFMSKRSCETRNLQSGILHSDATGFTLIEIMVALALLGASLLLLLDTHYSASSLFAQAQDEILMQNSLERAISEAEIAVRAGALEGNGHIGGQDRDQDPGQDPGYTFTWTAQPYGPVEGLPLLEIRATVNGPAEERSASLLVYLTSTASE